MELWNFIKFTPFVSNYILFNRGNVFHLKLLRRFRDIAVFVVDSFILPHAVDCKYRDILLYQPRYG